MFLCVKQSSLLCQILIMITQLALIRCEISIDLHQWFDNSLKLSKALPKADKVNWMFCMLNTIAYYINYNYDPLFIFDLIWNISWSPAMIWR